MSRFAYWIIGLFIYVLVFLLFFHPISAMSQDLGRHVLMGRIILQNWRIPTTNLLSYTYPYFSFVNTDWLSGVIFYLVESATGFTGLLIFTTTIACIAFVLMVRISKKTSLWTVGILALLYLQMLFERTDIRPEIFSSLFVSIFLWILYPYREEATHTLLGTTTEETLKRNKKHQIPDTKYLIWALPFLEILWVNIHIYFAIGPVLIGIFLAEELFHIIRAGRYKFFTVRVLDHSWPKGISIAEKEKFHIDLSTKNNKILTIVFLLTCLATLINPSFIHGALYPFFVFKNYGYTIQENQSIFFLENHFQATTLTFSLVKFFTVFIGILLCINRKKTKLSDWLLWGFFSYLAFSAVRNIPLFVFGTFTLVINQISQVAESIRKFFASPGKDAKLGLIRPDTILPVIFLILFAISFFFIITRQAPGNSLVAYSKGSVDFFRANHLSGPLFNTFNNGSYLDYRLYPNEKVFVDGRPEAYPASFFQKVYIAMQENPSIFAKEAKAYNLQTILFEHTDQTPWAKTFMQDILKNPDWSLVYLDNFSFVMVRKTTQNATLIQRDVIDANHGSTTIVSTKEVDLYQLDNFYSLVGWKEKNLSLLQYILSLYPNSCPALYQMAQQYYQTNNQSLFGIYSQKYQAICQR